MMKKKKAKERLEESMANCKEEVTSNKPVSDQNPEGSHFT
jgi:hypothetical protein